MRMSRRARTLGILSDKFKFVEAGSAEREKQSFPGRYERLGAWRRCADETSALPVLSRAYGSRLSFRPFQQEVSQLVRHFIRLKTRRREFRIRIRKLCRRSQFRRIQTPTACRTAFDLIEFINQ